MTSARAALLSDAVDALIGRLEIATGPDRELDAALWLSLSGYSIKPVTEVGGYTHDRWLDAEGVRWAKQATLFTELIDCAKDLVPAGYLWSVCSRDPLLGDPPYANVWPMKQPFPVEMDICCDGVTPAIALCIASLRARLA